VYFRKANVLAAGGVVGGDRWPVIDYRTGGWIGGLADGLSRLTEVANDRTRVVAADGAVLTRAELVVQRDLYQQIHAKLIRLLTSGLAPDEVVASQPTRGMMPQWGNADVFVTQAFKSLWPHHAPDA
jgi:hypothetical protein